MITVEVNKQEEEKPKDIFYNGNYVISKHGTVVLVLASTNYNTFSGVSIKDGTSNKEYLPNWIKDSFTQFTGTITITSK